MIKKNSIAIITARGGSKRIPGKNMKDFYGKPIIEYSISAAIDTGIFDEIMVSTDSKEIAGIAIKSGAKVPFMRSEATSNDYATTSDVLMEVFECYKKIGIEYEYACCLYPTAPFITANKIIKAMELLKNKKASEVKPVVPFSFPPQRCLLIKKDELEMKWPENRNVRSQDLETWYHDCGQFYCYDVNKYIEAKGQLTTGIVPMVMLETEVQDIDNLTDWKLAEMKYKLMKEKLMDN